MIECDRLVRIVVIALLVVGADMAQQQAGVISSDVSEPGGLAAGAGASSSAVNGIYITGGVIMRSGQDIPEPIEVRVRCGGRDQFTAFTTQKGDFRINVAAGLKLATGFGNTQQTVFGQVQAPEEMGYADMSSCNVRAVYLGHESTEIRLGRHGAFENPEIGELILTRLDGTIGDIISMTSAQAPRKARRNFDKASTLIRSEVPKYDKAAEYLETAVSLFVDYAAAWDLLGRVQLALGQKSKALESFEMAVTSDPRFIRPYPPLVRLLSQAGDYQRTLVVGAQTLKLDANRNDVRFAMAVAYLRLNKPDDATFMSNLLIQNGAASEYPQAYQILGMAQAQQGALKSAAESMTKYLELFPNAASADQIRAKISEWEQAESP